MHCRLQLHIHFFSVIMTGLVCTEITLFMLQYTFLPMLLCKITYLTILLVPLYSTNFLAVFLTYLFIVFGKITSSLLIEKIKPALITVEFLTTGSLLKVRGYFKKYSHFIFLKNLYLCYTHEKNVTYQYNLPSSRYI
jgi:hypothetical protein